MTTTRCTAGCLNSLDEFIWMSAVLAVIAVPLKVKASGLPTSSSWWMARCLYIADFSRLCLILSQCCIAAFTKVSSLHHHQCLFTSIFDAMYCYISINAL